MAVSASGVSDSNAPNSTPANARQADVGKPASRINSNSPMDLVNGGEEPVFGVEEINARKAGKKPAQNQEPKKVEAKKETPVQATEQSPAEPSTPADDILAALEAEYRKEAQTQERQTSDGELSPEDFGNLSERARNRIQAQQAKNQELAQQNEQLQQGFQQFQQQAGQAFNALYAQFQELKTENAKQSAMLEGYLKGRGPQENQEPEDPMDGLFKRLSPKFEEEMNKRLSPVQQELAQYKAREEKARKQAEINQGKAKANFLADRAASEILMKGFRPEAQQRLGKLAGTLTLALGYGRQLHPAQAAAELRQFMGDFAIEVLHAKREEMRKRVEENNNTPTPQQSGKSTPSAKGSALPKTWEEMKKLDPQAKDPADYMLRNLPPPI
jgi:hypothetical protein